MSGFDASIFSRTQVFESGKILTFYSKTNDKFEIPVEYTACSSLITESLELCSDDPKPEIPLINISTPTLVAVIEFMKEYTVEPFKNLPKPLPKNGIDECVRPFYSNFVKNLEMVSENLKRRPKDGEEDESDDESTVEVPCTSIVELLHASTFLKIEPLKQLCTAYMAQNLKEKNFTDIKKMFKCEDLNFDYKKMDKIYKDNAWCFEKNPNAYSANGGGGHP